MANLTAHDNESINSGYLSFIHRYNADGVARFAVARFPLGRSGGSAAALAAALGDDALVPDEVGHGLE